MSTYIPTAIDEKAFEQAKRDALAAFAPQGVVLGSGFMAGLIASWLPGLIAVPLLFLYNLAFGSGGLYGESKVAVAVERLASNAGAYSRVAIWVGLALGAYGILQAWLRQKACLADKFTIMEFSKYGEVRIGLEAKLTILGFPVLGVVGLLLAGQSSLLIVLLVFVVLSGFFYNLLWQKLDNMMLRMLFRPTFAQHAGLALRLMVPRHVGWKKVQISLVEVDQEKKTVRVEGEFETDIDEKEARNVIAHFMRGYHPIYLVNKRKVAS